MGPSQPHVKGNFHASVGKEKSCGVYSLYIAKAKAAKLAAKAIFACKAITRPKPLYIAKAKAAKLAAEKATVRIQTSDMQRRCFQLDILQLQKLTSLSHH